jgi:hypothetical protein
MDYSAPVSVFLTMHPAGASLPGRKLLMCAWHARLPDTSYLALKRELYLSDNWRLEQALRTDWETLTPNDLGIASLPKRRKLLQTTGRYTALDYEEVGASVGPIVIQKGAAEGGEDRRAA